MKSKLKQFGAVIYRAVISKRVSLLICFLVGVMGALPYFVEELFILTFVSLFFQFYIVILQKREHNRIFAPFFCYFGGFYTLLYTFLSEMYPYTRFGFSENQAIFVLICSCIAIPLLHAAVEACIMLLARLFHGNCWDILGYAALWVIGEWVLSLGTLAFPWNGVAVSLTGFLPFLQTVSLFGKFFITFVTAAACYAFALALVNRSRIFLMIGTAVICLNTVMGALLWFIPTEKGESVTVACIQGNVLSNEKWESNNRFMIFDRYMSMTEDAAKNGAKLVILPESAIPQSFVPDGSIHKSLAEIAVKYDVTIIAGVSYYENDPKSNYNSVIAILPDGSLSERYDKRHLVPFGEFIPFADFIGEVIPFVGEFNSDTSDLTEGTEPIIIDTEYGHVAPLVCFDSIFPKFAREGSEKGAEFIAVVTNDSWFNDSAGIYTHLRHAQLRAIENRRYILRAANTGVSAIIDERGSIVTQTEPLTVDTTVNEVHGIGSVTLYTYTGDIILYISFFTILIFAAIYIRRKFYGKNTTS